MYCSNANAVDAQDPDATWSSDYRAVWLLNEKERPFKDYAAISANGPAGYYGGPVNLGYPAASGNIPDQYPVTLSGGWNPGARYAVYYPPQNRTYVVFPGGEPLVIPPRALAASGLSPEGDEDLPRLATPTPGALPPASPKHLPHLVRSQHRHVGHAHQDSRCALSDQRRAGRSTSTRRL
jgi:hypothetical protein